MRVKLGFYILLILDTFLKDKLLVKSTKQKKKKNEISRFLQAVEMCTLKASLNNPYYYVAITN